MNGQARKLRGDQDTRGAQDTQGASGDRQDSEQPVSWLELFFDLVFVTAFDRLAQRLLAHPDLATFGIFLLMFVALWWAWLGNTSFAARYGNSCRPYRWGTLAQMLPMAALAVSIRGDLNDVGQFFALSYAVGRGVLILMLLVHHGRRNGGLPASERSLVLAFVAGALLWAASAWLSGPSQLLLWGLALGVDILGSLLSERGSGRELPHEGHFPERVGLLFIVFLGAVVTELIRGAAEQRLRLADQLPGVLAFLSIVAIWRLYFDEAHTLPALIAKRSGKATPLLLWAYTHLPLTLGLSVLSVGLGLGIAEEGRAADRHERLLVGAALAVIFLSLSALRVISVRALNAQPDVTQPDVTQPDVPDPPAVPAAAGQAAGFPGLGMSTLARLLGTGVALLLIPLPIGTTAYQALCAALTLLVGYLSWRDPLRRQLNEIEDELSGEPGSRETV